MATKELADSRTKVYSIPIRSITANTNSRQPLAGSLDSQGWTVFGSQSLWALATSDNPEERAKYVQLISDFDPDIVSLAATMLSQGQLQPVECREGGSKDGENHSYTLSFGCRRCLAILYNWCLLGKPKEPVVNAVLVKGNESKLLQRGLVENIRKPQGALEEAKTIAMLLNNGQTKEELAVELGMSLATLGNRLRLLDLPVKVQKKIASGELKATKALADEKAESNGKHTEDGETAPRKKMRSRKDIEAALNEFLPGSKEHDTLAWVLCLNEGKEK